MKIERYRQNGKILNRAYYKKSNAIFKHCANGRDSVSTRIFNTEVTDLLFLHGINLIEIIDKT